MIVAVAVNEDGKREMFGAFTDASRDDVLAYMSFPREHWAQIASANPLERVNREIKRRTDVIGISPNDAAIVRLVGALMLEPNDESAVARRYMSRKSHARHRHLHRQAARPGVLIRLGPFRRPAPLHHAQGHDRSSPPPTHKW